MSNKLVLNYHNVKDLDKLSRFKNLWILDLSNNMIECVNGLNSFVALGSVNLSNNKLSWKSLENIKELYIIYLELHGNVLLDNDHYYRQQIIDIFPRLFCLDGIFINVVEREETRIFFERSNFDKFPVRRRVKKEKFRSTSCKSLRLYGNYSPHAFEFLTQFPNTIPLNEEWDKKKIRHVAQFVVSDIICDHELYEWILKWVENLLEYLDDVQRISDLYVVLILFVANIEFDLGVDMFKKTLKKNNMKLFRDLDIHHYFRLPKDQKITVLSVFQAVLSLANSKNKIQVACVVELFYAMQNLLWVYIRNNSKGNVEEGFFKNRHPNVKLNYWLSKSLIAAETFMVLSKVKSFFKDLSDHVLNNIIDYATGHSGFIQNIQSTHDENQIETEILVKLALFEIQNNVQMIFSSDYMTQFKSQSHLYNKRQVSVLLANKITKISDNLSRGHSSLKERTVKVKENEKTMEIGDVVLLCSQMLATVMAIPEKNSVLIHVKRTGMPNCKGKNQNLINQNMEKINPKLYEWNSENGFWIPVNSTGDRIFLSKVTDVLKPPDSANTKRPVLDLSKINLCDKSIDEYIENEEHENYMPTILHQSMSTYTRETSSATKSSPRPYSMSSTNLPSKERKLMIPNFAKLEFSEKKDCLKFERIVKPQNTFFLSLTPRPHQVSAMSSSRPTITNATTWLGNGDYLFRNVRWNSRNPDNMRKRFHIPGYIARN